MGTSPRITRFRAEFDPYLIGMSDHTLGVAGGWMTAALGGVCIEKHYTLDKTLPDVPDHAMSVDPVELAELVAACDRGALLRGDDRIGIRDSEIPARQNARRSLVLREARKAGHLLSIDDLDFRRPGAGLSPALVDKVVGRRLRRNVTADTPLQDDDVEGVLG